jgi:Fe-S-cluster formation regulator IscX/YfhJ
MSWGFNCQRQPINSLIVDELLTILKRIAVDDSEFSDEFGDEFHPSTITFYDLRKRVESLEQFEIDAIGNLRRQQNINMEFVKLGILQQDKLM